MTPMPPHTTELPCQADAPCGAAHSNRRYETTASPASTFLTWHAAPLARTRVSPPLSWAFAFAPTMTMAIVAISHAVPSRLDESTLRELDLSRRLFSSLPTRPSKRLTTARADDSRLTNGPPIRTKRSHAILTTTARMPITRATPTAPSRTNLTQKVREHARPRTHLA